MKEAGELFSFDIRAYLKKSASYTLKSPGLYTVELIRNAISRGALNIRINTGRSIFEIYDDGAGIGRDELEKIKELADKNINLNVKRSHIKELTSGSGIGNLAIFAPEYKGIRIENRNAAERVLIELKNDESYISNNTEISKGTRIVIERHCRDIDEEIEMIRSSCRWSDKNIFVNGNKAGSEVSIPGTLASTKIIGPGNEFAGFLGIPESDEMCRIWIMNRRIVCKKKVLPPYRGFVFYAVVESSDGNEYEAGKLTKSLERLYTYIANNHHMVNIEQKKRIEQLLFFHFRETGDRQFMKLFSPFTLYYGQKKVGYSEVEKMAENRTLYAVREQGAIRRGSSDIPAILQLSPLQSDFLINRMGIRIVFMDPYRRHPSILKRLRLWSMNLKFRLFTAFTYFFGKRVDPDLLWEEERRMINLLNQYFERKDIETIKEHGFESAEVRISKGLSFYPMFFNEVEGGLIKKKLYINLARNSPVVKKAAILISKNSKSCELLSDLIMLELQKKYSGYLPELKA